jgi:hypothetical protein
MRKKMVISMALLLLLAAIVFPMAEARAAMMDATGSCGMSRVGKSVTFSGLTLSSDDEDVIRVTITLQEKRDGVWHGVSSKSRTKENTDLVTASKTYTVSGGHYYRVYATHYAKTGNVESSTTSWTEQVWIPE